MKILPRPSAKGPQFVVLGQGKAGTSLIFRTLSKHPKIGLSKPKELHYFVDANFDKGDDWYYSHFGEARKNFPIVGEVSPSYLNPKPLGRLAETLGRDTKVIFVLRRPIEKAFSRYIQNISANQRANYFHRIVHELPERVTTLIRTIELCYDYFGADNVLPLQFEQDIACDSPSFERKICAFLGLPDPGAFKTPVGPTSYNRGVMPRYLCTDKSPLVTVVDGVIYRVPPEHLVFCAQKRNTVVYENASHSEIADALIRQSRWTPEVSEDEYRNLQEAFVLDAATQIEQKFGYDMSHWRIAPKHLHYPPATPPDAFILDEFDPAEFR